MTHLKSLRADFLAFLHPGDARLGLAQCLAHEGGHAPRDARLVVGRFHEARHACEDKRRRDMTFGENDANRTERYPLSVRHGSANQANATESARRGTAPPSGRQMRPMPSVSSPADDWLISHTVVERHLPEGITLKLLVVAFWAWFPQTFFVGVNSCRTHTRVIMVHGRPPSVSMS